MSSNRIPDAISWISGIREVGPNKERQVGIATVILIVGAYGVYRSLSTGSVGCG
ncbi:MAG: hypothetical protein ACR2JB_27965 [Bryobacteraceae bacterium]